MVKSILKEREEYQINEATELKSKRTNLLNLLKEVMLRYGKGEIKTDVYETTREAIDQELADIDAVLEKELSKKTNLEKLAREAALTACKLDDLWAYGTIGNRQKVQNLVFPEGIIWEQTNRENLTKIESEAFRIMRSISDSFENEETKKEEKPFDFSSVVAGAGLEPATSGL